MIEIVAEIGSTSGSLSGRVAKGESLDEGHWLVADRQTSGKGRQGRIWSDGAGNFMGSTAARLRSGDPLPHTLSLVAGVAVHDAVVAVAPGVSDLALKWPNDLLVGDVKLAGILLQRTGDVIIVGIGVNLKAAPQVPGRSTISLSSLGHVVDRNQFANVLADHWHVALDVWHAGAWDHLRADWLRRAHPVGTALRVHGHAGEVLSGTFADLDTDGALQLLLGNGTTRTIHAGDVMLDART